MNFKGKTAIVTGVSHGIGKAAALKLAELGANLVLADKNEEGLKTTAAAARKIGAEVIALTLDVSDEQAVCEAVEKAEQAFGTIDILINNAGIYNTWGAFEDSDPESWKQKINVNILGTMYFSKAVIPCMKKNGGGKIVNIGSVAGVYGVTNMADYSMTKGAVIAFTKVLAKELGQYKINVNAVSPGSIDVTDNHTNPMTEYSFLGRAGTPEECANVIVFLASDEADYVNGQNWLVDGCRKYM